MGAYVWCRFAQAAVGIEEVANFNHNYGEEYVLGKVNVESVSRATKWQRDMVKRAPAELKNCYHYYYLPRVWPLSRLLRQIQMIRHRHRL